MPSDYYPRIAEHAVSKALRSFPVVTITGARQAGKTTMLRERFGKGRKYVSLDALDMRQLASRDPRAFLERNPPPAIIDEIQNVPEILHYIKEAVDADRKPGQFILTGSKHFPLMGGISESLAGRAAILPLFPLSIREIMRNPHSGRGGILDSLKDAAGTAVKGSQDAAGTAVKGSQDAAAAMLRGGYPELHSNPDLESALFFSSYVQTYVDRDVRGSIRNENLRDFESFLKLAAARTGQILNLSGLASDAGVSVPTAKSWISILEAASIVFLLPPYHRNFGKRIVKSPKLFFIDTGLASFLTGHQTADQVRDGPMAGALFETFVISDILKRTRSLVEPANLCFWRSSDGHEVDLLVESGGKIAPVEIKLSSTHRPEHRKGLDKWRDISGSPKNARGWLITSSTMTGDLGDGVSNIHWAAL